LPLHDLPMSATRPTRFLALPILALLGIAAGPARAAEPTMSECLSANESSIHLRGDHKLRKARDEAAVCAESSCPDEVRDTCQKRILELSGTIPTIVFLAKDSAGHDLVAVRVSMDGEPIADRLDGTGIPIDPGVHAFTFEVAGQPAVEQSVVIGEGQKDRRETITFGAAPAVAPDVTPPPPLPPMTPAPPEAPAKTSISVDPRQRVAGVVIGAVGVIGLGIGAVFGGLTLSEWSNADAYCKGKTASCATSGLGAQDESSAKTAGTISTVGFIAGGALSAAGLVLFLTAPKHPSSDIPVWAREVELVPQVGPGDRGLMIRTRF
jgi:hypothetical protein